MSIETSTDLERLTEQLAATLAELELAENARDTALYTIDQLSERLVAARAATNTVSRAQLAAARAALGAAYSASYTYGSRYHSQLDDMTHAVIEGLGMTVATR